jgi:hypothetical protein
MEACKKYSACRPFVFATAQPSWYGSLDVSANFANTRAFSICPFIYVCSLAFLTGRGFAAALLGIEVVCVRPVWALSTASFILQTMPTAMKVCLVRNVLRTCVTTCIVN